MKRFAAFITILLFSTITYSQNFSISIERSQTAYLGLDNRISCTVEGVPSDSILLSTDNGIITKVGFQNYNYRPSKIVDSKIIIKRKTKGNSVLVGEYSFMVKELPNPIAQVGGLGGGQISKKFLIAQGGVGAYPPNNLGFELRYQVQHFFITAIRNKQILFSKYVEGNQFAPDVHKLFDLLQKDDIITFSLIVAKKADRREVRVNALEFIIE